MAPPENSVTNSRADCALTQQMIGCIKAISPCVKSASAKLFLDLHTVLAPSGEERTLEEAAQVERAAWCCGQRNRNTPTSCRSFGKAANQPADAANQNWCSCRSLSVEIRTVHLDEEPRDTIKDARARVCAMVGCAKESAPLDLKDIATPTSQEVCLSSCVGRERLWRGRRRWPYRWSRSHRARASRGRD